MVSPSDVRTSARVRASAAHGDGGIARRSPPLARIQDKRQHDRRRRGRKTRRMRREFVLRAVSHNVQSLRQPESIELVISFMRERGVDIYAVQETWREGSGVETSALTRNIRSGSPAAAGESCEREVGRRLGARQPKMSISSKSCLRGWRLTAASFYSCTSTPTPARTTRSQLAMMVPTEWRSLGQKLAGGTKRPFSGSLGALLGLPGKWCCSWQQ